MFNITHYKTCILSENVDPHRLGWADQEADREVAILLKDTGDLTEKRKPPRKIRKANDQKHKVKTATKC